MSLLKRSFLSIIRNKTKSILLLLAVFVTVATFATSFNLYQTTTYIDKSIKASLDNYITVYIDGNDVSNLYYEDKEGFLEANKEALTFLMRSTNSIP